MLQGVGVGLKPEHFNCILATKPNVDFFEIHAENYMVAGGPFHHYLGLIRQDYALSLHGVGLSLGAHQAPSTSHLAALKSLLDRYQPALFSEHLAWSSHGGAFFNDLLPIAYTTAALNRICTHIDSVQTYLGRQMLLENPSTYLEFETSTYSEADFIGTIVARTGCGLLLDVNNLYVSCSNHNWNAAQYLQALPLAAVQEIHLAGFSRETDALGAPLLIDSHGSQVDAAVWALLDTVLAGTGPVPILIEWDNNLPEFSTLWSEAQLAKQVLAKSSATRRAP